MVSRRWLARVMGAVTAAVACVAGAIAGPAPALADDPGVVIGLTAVTPSVWSPGATLSISGTVTNNTGQNLTGARVVMWASTTALTTLTNLDAALTASATTPGGVTLNTPTSTQDLVADANVLADGAQATFTVEGQPNLPTVGAAYLVGVEVVNSRGAVLARARVTLGVQGAGALASALVVPLTSRPSLVTPSDAKADPPTVAVFRDDHLADELNGTLGALIALAGKPGVTALIDPSLVDALTQMAGGYVVAADADATPVPGEGQAQARAALASIGSIVSGGSAYRTLAGDPDIGALAGLPQASSIMAIAAKPPSDSALASLPLAVLARGAVTDDARRLIDGLAPSLVLTDALTPSATAQGGPDGVRWVALTPVSSLGDVTGPLPEFDGSATLQPSFNRLARFVVAAAQGAPTVAFMDDDSLTGTVSDWLGAGWHPEALPQAVAGLKTTSFDWVAGLSPTVPSSDLVAGVGQTQTLLALWADLGNDQKASDALGARVLPGAVASSWDGDWASALGWLQQATSQLNAQVGTGEVTLYVAAQWHLSSRDNRVPITITNTMGIPVTVKVHFVSENPQRLSVPDTDFVTVEAGNTASVVVSPQASANGSVQVTATLVTRGGQTVGDPQYIQVVTTAAGRLGWIIIIGAGVAFVIATSLRVRQVRHQRAAERQGAEAPGADRPGTDVPEDVPEQNEGGERGTQE